jgi:hypothetical protein
MMPILLPLPLWPICAAAPPSPHKALENVLHCCFIRRHARKCLKTYSEFSFLDGSNDTNYSSLGLY